MPCHVVVTARKWICPGDASTPPSREGGRELKRLEMGKEESGTEWVGLPPLSLFRLSWDVKVSGRERCGDPSKNGTAQGQVV